MSLTCPRPKCQAKNRTTAKYCGVCGELLGLYEHRNDRRVRERADRRKRAELTEKAIAERALVKALVAERRGATFRFCEFCGAPSVGRACAGHKDLLEVDPHNNTIARGGAAA